MIDLWLNAIDNGKMIGTVLVDFKKAFDLVAHQILLNKLEIYGIIDEALLWFNTDLTNRKQQVKINNSKSDFKHISGHCLSLIPVLRSIISRRLAFRFGKISCK